MEVYTNLTFVRDEVWAVLAAERVSLATSFYARDEAAHDTITQRGGSHKRTVHNIERAVALNLPIRVGIIEVGEEQDVNDAARYLSHIDVRNVRVDRTRRIGRAERFGVSRNPVDELCGGCADARAAIDSLGRVYPCVFARWLPIGNVLESSLRSLVGSQRFAATRAKLQGSFACRDDHGQTEVDARSGLKQCAPCSPDQDCNPKGNCNPSH